MEPIGAVHTGSHTEKSREGSEESGFWRSRRKILLIHTSFHLLLTTASRGRSFYYLPFIGEDTEG